ncbi:MAG TPA: FAD-dependent oxidoreductase [Gemmatimonadales bacterium]|nr:FAD-dependent oxidoreductase [Gemmatimonadales bacterium]
MADTQYLIVGGGLAAASAIEGIRELDPNGSITLISAERELPYHRPPLSKGFLAGRELVDSIRVHDAAWYRDNKVKVRLGQVARSVHMGKQGVTLESGERVSYERLLLCTGASARRLSVPGADLEGILYLRSLEDCYDLKRAIQSGARLVICGGGFIGMEVAATARHLGVSVTVLEASNVVYRAFASAELSAYFLSLLASQGVTVKTASRVARFLPGNNGRVAAVQIDDGTQVPADVVLVGAGAEPNTGWLATSGFAIDRGGLIVNVRLETQGKNVWAAGDIARFPDPVSKQPRRLEHWDNALHQGKQAGRNMAGAGEAYTHQSAFFSDLLDITINVLGDTDQPDEVTIRGNTDEAAPSFTALYRRGGRLAGAVMVNLNTEDRSAEFAMLQQHIAAGTMPE